MPRERLGTLRVHPLWWRLPAWTAITAVSAAQAHGTGLRVATAVLLGAGAVALQFIQHADARVRAFALIASTVGGLGACLTSPSGIAEILVLVAASRAAVAVGDVAVRWFAVVDTLAFGATIGWISHSLAGLLAGLGVPLLVQRAVEHRDLVRERDRATALLVEVQHGRESEARAAALQERGRIAREMHDVLAHSLAGLSVQLQAARAVAAREQVGPEVLAPLDRAAGLARDGLAEARAVVSTLRDPGGLGLDEVAALIDRHPGDTHLTIDGPPGTLEAEAGHAIYRAVQESLTNAARHAPGSAVTVALRWTPGHLLVAVTDSGPGPGRSRVPGQGSGLGLAGMGERLDAVGGTLHAGPVDDGWRVAIGVPTHSAAPDVSSPVMSLEADR